MKQETGHQLSVILRAVTLGMLIVSGLLFSAYQTVPNDITDIINRAGLSRNPSQEVLLKNLISRSFETGSFSILKKLAIEERSEAATELFSHIRKQANSEEFRKKYQELRERNRPERLTALSEEQKLVRLNNYYQGISLFKNSMIVATRDEKAVFAKQIIVLERQIEELNNPALAIERWNKEYPVSADLLIYDILTQFLDETSDIDFDAQTRLSRCKSVTRFVKPEYERKPSLWKIGFRAGEEATLKVRELAAAWKAELDQNKISGNP